MIKTFKCFGGPLDGHIVTSQYAGDDYVQYNSSVGECYPRIIVNKKWCVSGESKIARQNKVKPYADRAILLYCPPEEDVHITKL